MHPRKFALVMGIVFLALGVLAFIPDLSTIPSTGLPALRIENSYGLFFGTFAMNIVNKLILIAFGAAGIGAYLMPNTSLPASIHFSRWVFAVMGAFSILGMIPQTNTLFDYAPLYGNEVWLHGVYSLLGAYFGYALSKKAHMINRAKFPGKGIDGFGNPKTVS